MSSGPAHAEVVGDLMTTDLVTASPDDPVGRVRQQLVHLPIGAVPIMEYGALVGIVTLVDLDGALHDAEPIEKYACAPVTTIPVDASIGEAADRFIDRHTHHMVVVEDGKPVGIVSTFDFVALLR